MLRVPRILALTSLMVLMALSAACSSPSASQPAISQMAEDGRLSLGNPAAPVSIVEFTDFHCPYCSRGAQTLKEVMKKYDGQVRLVVRHFPLSGHPAAMPAALYFEAIGLQNPAAAWKFYDALFADQEKLSGGEDYLKKVAENLDLNMERLAKDLENEKIKARIAADMRAFETSRFDGVPVFVVNGTVLIGAQPAEALEAAIQDALK